MTNTPYQPVLPAEVAFTDAELNFMEESPPGLFPENQNSNFGYVIRKIFSDRMQEAIDQVETLYTEKFIDTSTLFLDRWEADYGLPVAPTGKTISERRSMVTSRIQIGSFSRDRVNGIIEAYLGATSGETISLTPEGVAMAPGGVPLFGEFTPGQALYRVYEDIRNFSYQVWILNTVTPDIPGMTRELARITPSGISFTIDNTKTNVLDYMRTIKNKQPIAYYILGNTGDESGYGNNLTAVGGATVGNAAALPLNTGNTAIDLSSSAQYLTAPHHPLHVGMHDLTLEGWIRIDSMPPTDYGVIFMKDGAYQFRIGAGGTLGMFVKTTDPLEWAGRLASGLVTGVVYHVVGVKRGDQIEVWVNAVRSDSATDAGVVPETILPVTSILKIGGTGFANENFNGVLDELKIYNYALSPEEILENFNTGLNIA